MFETRLAIGALFALIATTAWPQGSPEGPEFRVNTYTVGDQSHPSTSDDNGFIVVWTSAGQDGSGDGVFGQMYFDSTPLGPEFRVNSYTTNAQRSPAVGGSGDGIFGQRYSSSGAPLGDEFRVNSYTTNDQVSPRMSPGGQGGISTVVWMSDGQDGSGWGIFGRALFLNEGFLGQEFQVNSYTTGSQSFPAAAEAGPGYRVIVWQSDAQDGSGTGIYGQRYAGSGGRTSGPEFRVNTYTSGDQARPSVTAEATTSQFRIVWDGPAEDGTPGLEVYGQRFGPIFPVDLIDVVVE